jgi:hypothetical protein
MKTTKMRNGIPLKVGDNYKYWIDNIKSNELENGSLCNMEERESKIVSITPYHYHLEDGTVIPRF